jgi:hypothetical protein
LLASNPTKSQIAVTEFLTPGLAMAIKQVFFEIYRKYFLTKNALACVT